MAHKAAPAAPAVAAPAALPTVDQAWALRNGPNLAARTTDTIGDWTRATVNTAVEVAVRSFGSAPKVAKSAWEICDLDAEDHESEMHQRLALKSGQTVDQIRRRILAAKGITVAP